MAKYICLAFKPFSTPTRLCSQALSAFPAHSPLPRSNSKGFLCCLCSCLCSLPGPQASVLSSLPGLPGLSISQEGEQAECALSLLASVPQRPAPQHPVLRLLCVSQPRASVLECGGPCCLQLSPADGCGISSIPQRQALQYKVFKSQLSALEGCVQAKPKPLGLAGCEHFGGEAEVVRRVWGEVAISFLRRRDTLKGKGRQLRCGRVNRDSPLSRDLARETLSTHRKHGTQN